jgi:hypothetical protein
MSGSSLFCSIAFSKSRAAASLSPMCTLVRVFLQEIVEPTEFKVHACTFDKTLSEGWL